MPQSSIHLSSNEATPIPIAPESPYLKHPCSVASGDSVILGRRLSALQDTAANQFAGLGPRERQVMELVLTGLPSKNIAADLRISQRTVKNHRAAIMKKTFAKSIPALARLAIAAAIPCDARIEMGHDRDKETQQQRMPTCEKTDFRFDAAFACGHSVIIECVPNHCGSRSGYLRDW